jgi:hypothetical protein
MIDVFGCLRNLHASAASALHQSGSSPTQPWVEGNGDGGVEWWRRFKADDDPNPSHNLRVAEAQGYPDEKGQI